MKVIAMQAEEEVVLFVASQLLHQTNRKKFPWNAE